MFLKTVIVVLKQNYIYKIFIFIYIFILCYEPIFSQNRYWVFLTDKKDVEFNPYDYFDGKAILRRRKLNLSLYDTTDYPINQDYLRDISRIADHVNCTLRWFNAISITATETQITKIKQLAFVRSVLSNQHLKISPAGDYDTVLSFDENQLWKNQIDKMQGNLFAAKGFTGKGIRIAVFDAGFPQLNKIQALKHLTANNQIKATWDFARKRESVASGNIHGIMVLSAISGIINNKKLGLATDSEFLLARTEVDRTSIAEEEYWLQAVEWADRNGADIINSSLAYTYERYNTFDMDGKTSLIAKAANMAAGKGMLVINAMGNDGNHDWKIMATPADADSVLSVGAINSLTDFHAGFSSYGPTADYRFKPNLVASGNVIVATRNKLKKAKGTSFSAALVSGFAACAWQSMRYLTNMQLFDKLQESANLFPYFDYAHGYGVPQASRFLNLEKINHNMPTFDFKESGDTVWINIKQEYIDKNYLKNNNYLYYHIENNKGYLTDYWLIDVYKRNAAFIVKKEYINAKKIRAYYKGFTYSIELD